MTAPRDRTVSDRPAHSVRTGLAHLHHERVAAPHGRGRAGEATAARIILSVLLPFAGGYFLSYLFRNVNAVIAPDLVDRLGIDAGTLGYLTAAYFLAFAACQLPLGVLLDRYGPRRVEAALLLFAAAGATLFALGDGLWELTVGRVLIGIGVSACLMAAFKANALWWKPEQLPLANSCFMVVGGLGAVAATAPIHAALAVVSESELFLILAGATVTAAAAIYFLVPDREHETTTCGLGDQLRGVGHVMRSRAFWAIAPFTVAVHCAVLSFHALWAGPWLHDVADYDQDQVADSLALMSWSLALGFPVTGWIVDRLRRRGISPLMSLTVLSVAQMAMQGLLLLNLSIVADGVAEISWIGLHGPEVVVWMAFTFFGTASIVAYAVLGQCFPVTLSGRVSTGLNFLVFSVAFVGQWGTGSIIDLYPKAADGGYNPAGYDASLVVILAIQTAALAWLVLNWGAIRLRETAPR